MIERILVQIGGATVADTRETLAAHFRIAIQREKERVHLVVNCSLNQPEGCAAPFGRNTPRTV